MLYSNGHTIGRDLESAFHLRPMHAWAMRQYRLHRVDDWTWWMLWEPEPAYRMCPRCGWQFMAGCIRTGLCRCGLLHTRYECRYATSHTHHVPALHDGCGPLPYDPGAHRPARKLKHRHGLAS